MSDAWSQPCQAEAFSSNNLNGGMVFFEGGFNSQGIRCFCSGNQRCRDKRDFRSEEDYQLSHPIYRKKVF